MLTKWVKRPSHPPCGGSERSIVLASSRTHGASTRVFENGAFSWMMGIGVVAVVPVGMGALEVEIEEGEGGLRHPERHLGTSRRRMVRKMACVVAVVEVVWGGVPPLAQTDNNSRQPSSLRVMALSLRMATVW
jgi:hypothetical protein